MNLNEIEKLQLIVLKELNNRKVYEGATEFLTDLKSLAVFEKELNEKIVSLKAEREKLLTDVDKKKKTIVDLENDCVARCVDKETEAELILKKAKDEAKKLLDDAKRKIDELESTKDGLENKIKELFEKTKEAQKNKETIEQSIEETKRKLSGLIG